jgi:hypothetical protein
MRDLVALGRAGFHLTLRSSRPAALWPPCVFAVQLQVMALSTLLSVIS